MKSRAGISCSFFISSGIIKIGDDDMNRKKELIPSDLLPYIEAIHYRELIPKKDVPESIKKKIEKANIEFSICNPYESSPYADYNFYDFRNRITGRQFDLFPSMILKQLEFHENGIKLKNSNAAISEKEFEIYKRDYGMIIRYYKDKGYFLLFSAKDKLTLWKRLIMLLGLKRCYYFYGYDEKCPSTVPD